MSIHHSQARVLLVSSVLLASLIVAVISQPVAIAQGGDPLYPCGTQMRRVSVSLTGEQSPGGHGEQYVSLSADGRYVVFDSGAPLVTGDTNNAYDVFVLDCVANTLTRANVSSDEAQTNNNANSAGRD